jgi:hypothetical protein
MEQFKIIEPIAVNDANFVASNIAEDDFPVWDSTVTYDIGDKVILTTGFHKIYESLTSGNLNNNPATSATNWIEIGSTNRWAVFDESINSLSTEDSPLEWEVATGLIDSVALLGLDNVTQVQVIGTSTAEGVVYDETIVLEDSTAVIDWFDYFFADIVLKKEVIVSDIPPYPDLTVKVIVSGGEVVSVGLIIFGKSTRLGFTQQRATTGIIDFSRKETDAFGRTVLVKRKFSKRMSVETFLDNGLIDAVQTKLSDIRATPVLWVGAKDQFELLTVYGFYRDFTIDIAYANHSLCTLEIEGLT